jgi:hypothetical protein
MRAPLIAVLLVGCANLPDVSSNECGNGVHEPGLGEECDGVANCGPPETANACKLVCGDDRDGCPDGWGCGADLRCRRPTETFYPASVTSMSTSGVSVRDMDADGADDLLGYDSRGLVTRFGDAEGLMAASTRVPMPLSTTGSVTPDVDGASGLDLAVPLADSGWALFVNNGARGLVPAAQSAISLDFPGACMAVTMGAARWTSADKPDMIMSVGGFTLGFVDGDECSATPDCLLSNGGAVVDNAIRTAPLGYGLADGVAPGDQFTAAVVGQQSISVWGRDALAPRPKRIDTWLLPEQIGLAGHVSLLQLTASGCHDLIVDTGTSLAVVFGETDLGGTCTGLAAQAGFAVRFDHPPGTVIGAGNLFGVDSLLIVESFGTDPPEGQGPGFGGVVAAYTYDGAGGWTTTPLLFSDAAPHGAAVLDYNRDGFPDIALASDGTSTVDFHLNYAWQGFSAFPVDVGGTARMPVVGDFDGDLYPDLVVAVADPTNPLGRDHLYIVYGDPGGHPLPAQFLGDFVTEARPTSVPGGNQQLTDSLFVVSNNIDAETGTCERRLAILIGDTSRQLVSPYVLLYNNGTDLVGLGPLGMVDLSSPGVPSVLAMGAYVDGGGDEHVVASVLGFDGTNYQTLGITAELPVGALPSWYVSGAIWRTGDLDGDGQAAAVAISYDKLAVITFDGAALNADIQALPPGLQYPVWFDLVDMDGDDDLDLVGTGAGSVATPDGMIDAPASRYWVLWNEGDGFDPTAATELSAAPGLYCYDAAAIHSDDSGTPQLLAACYASDGSEFTAVLALATFDPERDAEEMSDTRIMPLFSESASVEVGDFTGDGLDDIAVLGSASVTMYRQCGDADVFLGAGCGGFAAP